MVRCCMCMRWHHGDCLPREEEVVGIWNCPKCRLIPQLFAEMKKSYLNMQVEMQTMSARHLSLETEIKEIKEQCTKLRDENKVLLAKLENTGNGAASSTCLCPFSLVSLATNLFPMLKEKLAADLSLMRLLPP